MVEEEVGTYEAKNRLSALVEAAEKGHRIWITRRGKRVALLCSGLDSPSAPNLTPLKTFRKIRKNANLGKEKLKDLIEEGRA